MRIWFGLILNGIFHLKKKSVRHSPFFFSQTGDFATQIHTLQKKKRPLRLPPTCRQNHVDDVYTCHAWKPLCYRHATRKHHHRCNYRNFRHHPQRENINFNHNILLFFYPPIILYAKAVPSCRKHALIIINAFNPNSAVETNKNAFHHRHRTRGDIATGNWSQNSIRLQNLQYRPPRRKKRRRRK